MKKILFIAGALMLFNMNALAQKYFDVYQKGKVSASIASNSIDSIGMTGSTMQERQVIFYRDGKTVNSYFVSSVDSIKVFRADEEPIVYMGIVGFNQELYEKPIDVLASSTANLYNNYVGNLSRKDGTLLYYAVDHAIDMLEQKSFTTPLTSVNMITFTDGLDQGSLMMNSKYTSDEQYLEAISKRIADSNIKGISLNSYSLGLHGSDVTNYNLFQNNLEKLASSSEKAFEVSSMGAVRTRLQEICDQIISISNRQIFSLKIPGQSDGTVFCFTFDGQAPENSSMYIEGTFNLANRVLTNISYHGIKATSGSFVQGTQDGIFVTFTFTGMQREDGNGLIPKDLVREYYKSSGSPVWQQNSEFSPNNNTQTTITHSGAVIMLVLDCSNSLGGQFGDMKSYAQDFIGRVAANTLDYKVEAPTDITASLTDDFFVQVSWGAVKHAERYDVLRSNKESDGYTKVATGLVETTWKDDRPLSGDNYYRVCAVGHGLVSPSSNSSAFVSYSLGAPTNAVATIPNDDFVIHVSWDEVKYAESYDIYRSNSSTGTFTKVTSGITSTIWTDPSPLPGNNCYYICAVGHGLTSIASNKTNVVSYALNAPTNVKAMIPSDAFVIHVSWDEVKYAESYDIYRSNSSTGIFTKIASGIKSTTWTDPSPLPGNNCYYVCAVGYGLTSPASNKTDFVDYSIASPSNVEAILNDDFEVIISWHTVKNAEKYDVYRSSSSSTGFIKVAEGLNTTQWKDNSPLHGANYYRIYAFYKDYVSNPSSTSNIVNYTLDVPTNVRAYIPDDVFVVRVSWESVKYAESYDIYRGYNPFSGFSKVATGIKTTLWTDDNPLHGENYYRIYSVGHGLTSEASTTSPCANYALDTPQNVIATYNSDENAVNLSWGTVKHAEGYEVYRNDELVANKIVDNYWKDTNPPFGNKVYYVCAIGHGLRSEKSKASNNVVGSDKVCIEYSGSTANVSITNNLLGLIDVKIEGAHVSVIQSGDLQEEITYELSGSSSNGSFYMDGPFKTTIKMTDLNLTNPSGITIDIEDSKRVNFIINGYNSISDGINGSHNATIYINGHSVFDGTGTLEVNGYTKHAINTDEHVIIQNGKIVVKQAVGDGFKINERFQMDGGNVSITSTGDGIDIGFRGANKGTKDQYEHNGFAEINGGTLTITTTGDAMKGLKADSTIIVTAGTVNITTSGGAYYDTTESDITSSSALKTGGRYQQTGGSVTLFSTGIGGKGLNSTGDINISGGTLSAVTTGKRYKYDSELDSKPQGIKSDGNIILSGGNIYSAVIDTKATTFKTDYTFNVNGATIMGIGGKAVTPTGSQKYKTYSGARVTGGQTVSYDGISFTVPSSYTNTSAMILVSKP